MLSGGTSTLLDLLSELGATAELKAPRSSPVLCKEEASELALGPCSELLPPRPRTGPPSTAFSPHLGEISVHGIILHADSSGRKTKP